MKNLFLILFLTFTAIFYASISHGGSMTCSDLTQDFCAIDKSSLHNVFCKNDSGHSYEGQISCEGKWSGSGTYGYPSGASYTGEWRLGEKHGQGKMRYRTGNWFEGAFRLGERLRGTMHFAESGHKLVVGYKNNKRHGKGTWYFDSGDRADVEYANGKQVGVERYYRKTGAILEYEILNGERGKVTIIKSLVEVNEELRRKEEKEKERARKREEKRKKNAEAQRQRDAEIKAARLKIDSCLLKIYKVDEAWSERDAEALCEIVINRSINDIMANCILDKGNKKPKSVFDSVLNVCENVAIDPSLMDKFKYASPFSEYLSKLK